VRRVVRRFVKYSIGFVLVVTGCVIAFNGTLQITTNGGALHSDKGLQYGMGAGVFVIGLLFLISAIRDKRTAGGFSTNLGGRDHLIRGADGRIRSGTPREARDAAEQRLNQQMRDDFNRRQTQQQLGPH
jgi:hypothetical protein